ncbi:TPA: hypothetical protein ACFNMI_000460 [Neisseria bacilliformis]
MRPSENHMRPSENHMRPSENRRSGRRGRPIALEYAPPFFRRPPDACRPSEKP